MIAALCLILLTAAPRPSIGLVNVYFSPDGGCTAAVVAEIAAAKKTCLVQAYSLTSGPITLALKEAKRRGVRVEVLVDDQSSKQPGCTAAALIAAGIPVMVAAGPGLAHNKLVLIDGKTILTGSFNFSAHAERENQENLLVIRAMPDLFNRYLANWRKCRVGGVPFQSAQPPKVN
jgi:phosphatidylserine/phosphatidylglycerophosphate/cardiolipin synthase-like enzyme